ncbi:hypothetical protein HaLaN_23137 [Haematococcus lacustris]|uniref:Uncharacterized protein n=1 Tax=Haematococcus lacustris TaxID=44745 RepID=A0A699ZZE8_HAELA|nr:hypothetical protein HaLaN_23137 [Haematococcus lacustris]
MVPMHSYCFAPLTPAGYMHHTNPTHSLYRKAASSSRQNQARGLAAASSSSNTTFPRIIIIRRKSQTPW